jgi:hypothetical protein
VTKAYSEDFAELTALAEKRLLHPEVDLPHHQEIFRLWRYPSFEQYVSWNSFVQWAEAMIAFIKSATDSHG